LLNALSGVRRVIRRLPRKSTRRTSLAHRPTPLSERVEHGLRSAATAAHLFPTRVSRRTQPTDVSSLRTAPEGHPGLLARLGQERVCALVVAALVIGTTAVSMAPATPDATAAIAATDRSLTASIGGPTGDARAPRIVVGGAFGVDRTGIVYGDNDAANPPTAFRDIGPLAAAVTTEAAAVSGPFLDDGTLLKPVSVDTTVADGKDLLRTYKVKAGDSLGSIGRRFKISGSSVYWANNLKSRELKAGTRLIIPPVSGLVVTVSPSDTLESLAKKHKIKADAILKTNGLEERNLVMGQVLVLPGAVGAPLPKPKPKPTPKATVSAPRSVSGPARYSGGAFAWPVAGGYISQYFHYGHYGLDIAADPGTTVKAAAGGTVTFAGWKSNGGGYQVWISHGSGLFTTYNHMSSVSVGTGQSVGRGQRVGRVGSTGYATGPHLHFEVWKGPIWNGGNRVNPLGYL
jgi:murein DD-endopeptidase MepM/ murein hydrolase activator NlpD